MVFGRNIGAGLEGESEKTGELVILMPSKKIREPIEDTEGSWHGAAGERDRALQALAVLEVLGGGGGWRLGALMAATGLGSGVLSARLADLVATGLVEAGRRGRSFAPTREGRAALSTIFGPRPAGADEAAGGAS